MDHENYQLAIDIMETEDERNKEFNGINIMKKLDQVEVVSGKSSRSDRYIKKLPKYLRNVNAEAYKPQIITIGPYYPYKNDFEAMEEHKLRRLKMVLNRRNEPDVERYMKAMGELKEQALPCYPDFQNTRYTEKKFVETMLLDACFIVELFRNYSGKSNDNEPLLDSRWMEQKLRHDLLLPDNQIPFFVLDDFFKITKTPDEEKRLHGGRNERNYFLTMIFSFFVPVLHNQSYGQDAEEVPTTGSYPFFHSENLQDPNAVKHLLSLVHDSLVDQIGRVSPNSGTRNCNWNIFSFLKTNKKNGFHRRCATKLKEAGIKFRELKSRSLLDIKFENGIMKIPKLKIDDGTESFFRNLILYEHLCTDKSNPVIDYMNFMDSLINSGKDVELLSQHNIFDNCLGDDKVVARMFNKLGDLVTFSSHDHYREIYEKMNKHCNRSWNRWMANLRHNYFNTPWSLISFLAAVLLLVLTVGQTVFSVLTYFE